MLTTFVALLAISQPIICKRCHHDVLTPIHVASPIAAKRAGMKDETKAVVGLIMREAGWATPSRHSRNPTSTAYGLGQFLNSTWKSVGIKKTACHVCQIEAIYRYCRTHRSGLYGNVAGAVRVWDTRAKAWAVKHGKRHNPNRPRGGTY